MLIHVDSALYNCFGGLGDGGLDYVVFEIRLHYKLDVFYNIAAAASRASSYIL